MKKNYRKRKRPKSVRNCSRAEFPCRLAVKLSFGTSASTRDPDCLTVSTGGGTLFGCALPFFNHRRASHISQLTSRGLQGKLVGWKSQVEPQKTVGQLVTALGGGSKNAQGACCVFSINFRRKAPGKDKIGPRGPRPPLGPEGGGSRPLSADQNMDPKPAKNKKSKFAQLPNGPVSLGGWLPVPLPCENV